MRRSPLSIEKDPLYGLHVDDLRVILPSSIDDDTKRRVIDDHAIIHATTDELPIIAESAAEILDHEIHARDEAAQAARDQLDAHLHSPVVEQHRIEVLQAMYADLRPRVLSVFSLATFVRDWRAQQELRRLTGIETRRTKIAKALSLRTRGIAPPVVEEPRQLTKTA